MVEQRTENPRVGGSIPPLGTIFFRAPSHKRQTSKLAPKLPLQEECLRKILGGVEVQNCVTAFSVALDNLLAEFHSHLRYPSARLWCTGEVRFRHRGAEKTPTAIPWRAAVPTAPHPGRFRERCRPGLHLTWHVKWSLHKDRATPGAPLLKFCSILCHGFTYPQPVMSQVIRASAKFALSISVKFYGLKPGGNGYRSSINPLIYFTAR